MEFQEITVNSIGGSQLHIIIEAEDGSIKSFPKDDNNPEYIAFKEQLED